MKAVSFVRVSTDVQDFNRQVTEIKDYCKKEQIEIIKEISEKESGKHRERKALTELMNFVEENEVDCVIVSEISRLGRTSKVLETIETLNQKKISLHAIKEKVETLNPDKTINTTSSLLILSDLYQTKEPLEIAKEMERPIGTIYKKLYSLKIEKPYSFTEEETEKLIVEHAKTKTDEELAVQFKVPIGEIKKKITELKNAKRILRKVRKPKNAPPKEDTDVKDFLDNK